MMNHDSKTYHITSVKDTTFDPDKYGNKFYSITMDEHQGPLLWKTKERPASGIAVYGHTELSQSGKAMLFKKDMKPEGYQEPAESSFTDKLAGQLPLAPESNVELQKIVHKTYKMVAALYKVLVVDIQAHSLKDADRLLTPDEEEAIVLGGSPVEFPDDMPEDFGL